MCVCDTYCDDFITYWLLDPLLFLNVANGQQFPAVGTGSMVVSSPNRGRTVRHHLRKSPACTISWIHTGVAWGLEWPGLPHCNQRQAPRHPLSHWRASCMHCTDWMQLVSCVAQGGRQVRVVQHTAQHTGDLVSPCIREPSVGEYLSEWVRERMYLQSSYIVEYLYSMAPPCPFVRTWWVMVSTISRFQCHLI